MEKVFYGDMYTHESTHWWYTIRRRLIHKLIARYAALPPLRILDVGCGTGKLAEELQNYGEIICIDPSAEAVRFCKERLIKNVFQSSLEDYSITGPFDCVIALDVLEHCADDALAISKLHSLLKPGGIAIIFVPALRAFWSHQDEISHHYRRYAIKELDGKFRNRGFQTLFISYFNFFLAPAIWLARKTINLLGFEPQSELSLNTSLLNGIFKGIFFIEYLLLPNIRLPFGVSVMGIYKKEK